MSQTPSFWAVIADLSTINHQFKGKSWTQSVFQTLPLPSWRLLLYALLIKQLNSHLPSQEDVSTRADLSLWIAPQHFPPGPSKMQKQRCSVILSEIILMSQEMSLKPLQSFNKLLLGRMDFQLLHISTRQSNYREALCPCPCYKIHFLRVYNYNMPIKIYFSLKLGI